jgi:hypothetical protein
LRIIPACEKDVLDDVDVVHVDVAPEDTRSVDKDKGCHHVSVIEVHDVFDAPSLIAGDTWSHITL